MGGKIAFRIEKQAGTMTGGARLVAHFFLKFFALIGPALALWFMAPIVWGLLETWMVLDLEKQLRQSPPDQAYLVLERISEIGPKGSPALARALSHPDDAVFSQAFQILSHKVRSWNVQTESEREVLATIRELNRVFPQLVPSRQKLVTALIDNLLDDYHQCGRSNITILQLCEPMMTARLSEQHSASSEITPTNQNGDPSATVVRFRSSGPVGQGQSQNTDLHEGEERLPQKPSTERFHEAPPAIVDGWQLPANELAAWKEVIAAPVAQLTIFEDESESSQMRSRSFGPGRFALALAEQPNHDGGWKSVSPVAMERDAGTIVEANHNGLPQTVGSTPSPQAPSSEQGLHSGTTRGPARVELTTLEPLFAQLSQESTEADQARESLLSLGLNADMIEAGRMAFHPNAEFRRQAVRTIWQISGIDPLPFLFRLAKDSDPTVRQKALAVLATVSNPGVQAFVRDAISHDDDPQIQRLADGLDSGGGNSRTRGPWRIND